ncbi:MAG: nucleotidyl transferase AbiEii/AbiGii toxin family protein [Nitrospirae bacterium]|nr:nucleotidyl transferase AbiEii/AbiGii toxin family protein [Nitrospirota bacterium]
MHKACFPEKGWKILASIKEIVAKRNAILCGGTALALQMGHRESLDLDFFTTAKFSVESLISSLKKTGHSFELMDEGDEHLHAVIGGVKFSIFRYDYPFMEKPLLYEGITIAAIPDIADMKIIAISQRGTRRDFIDIYFILQNTPFHKIASHLVRHFGRDRVNPIIMGKSLMYFERADKEPDPKYRGKKTDWEKIKRFFEKHAKQFTLDLAAALESQ